MNQSTVKNSSLINHCLQKRLLKQPSSSVNSVKSPAKQLLNKMSIRQKLLGFTSKRQQNELDNMFMNSNVGIVRSQFNKTIYMK